MISTQLFFLFACILVQAQGNHEGCKWIGKAPFCGSMICPNNSRIVAVAQVGDGDFGRGCHLGEKSFCCRKDVIRKDFEKHCAWYGTAPACEGECPEGTVELARARTWLEDDIKDCILGGSKAFCCDEEVVLK
ncbi:hypothetical protein PFISCL1PPCAC_25464 [Pristionchus fissidentatus]|uniref:Uncharacterized protein n=1 Tax=Pristionchus fissidentatus TaxID=1538716 RepID=A0AAV5WWN3_9BILA|nr:hypothetical protein PFISCL1PPCAC_25464 [Pristionchus fissidentatus]